MSGTSVDAIDCALARSDGEDFGLVATHEHPIPPDTRGKIAALSQPGPDEIDRMGVLDRELGRLFAEAALALLAQSGTNPAQVAAIGSHGQTIRHRPFSAANGSPGFTLQIGDPCTIAEQTRITTVADFRRRDIAAGGEGAPLAPAFHAAVLAEHGVNRAIVNIGGIANATFLEGTELRSGFDTGPGNTLLDHWIAKHRGEPFDPEGGWAASGTIHHALLEKMLSYEYFGKSGPRSTGKEEFNLAWLEARLAEFSDISPADVQATLAALTSITIARAIENNPKSISAAGVRITPT
jgi:anhydro-N-acetylmuramic acid kinase